ncbi:hypothetical protein A2801_03210 [Candidatus Woesebacteria bacterium RIFCSPHIGHO2_01_FULL_41_10]|uniref:CBU-0592-like domain-containing protein n=1 Tax=Candidatus Woesebacteria bacterium RIFCSPHIGHO2_01_FULL_41_10 TaxID=1802500 RepID=A0A1F7YSZ8_9BACT|nr:MAG: hypothetical protein A2801_03210 [Candidatus Woesebacteria bacterium RIFCSPHIGHO2_01_FULL_41_10]
MNKAAQKISDIVGWYGVVAITLAYLLLNFGLFSRENLTYQFLNFSGALGIIMISLFKKAYQPAVLNIIWAAVALIAMLGIAFF